jgi:predicted AAA+ superfamily ATPase
MYHFCMIERRECLAEVRGALKRSRVAILAGPRQAGKTTLARQIVSPASVNYFDLENPRDLARLSEPMTALAPLRGTVVIDEIQRRPELFPILRVLADRSPLPARFLVLGSASPALLRQSSESLAGRAETVTLDGFDLREVGEGALRRHWRRGGFPPSYLARNESDSFSWRRGFIQTYLERDVASFGVALPASAMLRFWTMVAHVHGGVWNAADPARSLGVSMPTVRRYLDLFTDLYLVRQLQPWHENLSKRQVKAPKAYIRDSGLLHALLGLSTERELLSHPKAGSSWEGYAIEETIRRLRPDAAYFWATHAGAELDLLLFVGGRRYGVEVKMQDAPVITPSMRIALRDLGLQRLAVVYPGERRYPLDRNIDVVPLHEVSHAIPAPTNRTKARGPGTEREAPTASSS